MNSHDIPCSPPVSPFKSKQGLQRILSAARYSCSGLQAAWKHEAAFRQELIVGIPLMGLSIWIAPSLLFAVLMNASIVLVWCLEMINSAIESLADAISLERNILLGRAKDLGSAAVAFSMILAIGVWGAALFTYLPD